MSQRCFIGLDQGSSATKAVVLSTEGQLLFQTRKDLTPPLHEVLFIEQDPKQILTSVREALGECLRAVSSQGISVLGAGLACQRSSCLVWSGYTGEPLSP